MTEIIRNAEGKILGGPTLAQVEAQIRATHAEPPGRNAQICAALFIGHPNLVSKNEPTAPEVIAMHIGTTIAAQQMRDTVAA